MCCLQGTVLGQSCYNNFVTDIAGGCNLVSYAFTYISPRSYILVRWYPASSWQEDAGMGRPNYWFQTYILFTAQTQQK